MKAVNNTRALAAQLCFDIIDRGQSLDRTLEAALEASSLSHSDQGFVRELVYGVCRWYWQLDDILQKLLAKPLKRKDRLVHFVLQTALYQLSHLQTPDHAAVSESVKACEKLKLPWAKKLVNGCLRNYLRNVDKMDIGHDHPSHPAWQIDRISAAWPDYAERIMLANNSKPPMCLRVNQREIARTDYLAQLDEHKLAANADPYSRSGIILDKAVGVHQLPGFDDGLVSVQDTAAQLACEILQPQPGERIFDACAAPGGKTAHLLEATDNKAAVIANDISERRCEKLRENLARLKLNADVSCKDVTQAVFDSTSSITTMFDKIIIDAPCSGTGVIRRHPDIKHHRRPQDIVALQKTQIALLKQCWRMLASGGTLLYMTCSIFPEENEQAVQGFLDDQRAHGQNNIAVVPIDLPFLHQCEHGLQALPGVHPMDGFYYCLLRKND